MHDMRQIPCPMCGRSVMIRKDGPVPCPSCGVPVSAPATAEPLATIIPTDDDSATRIATIPPSEPAPVETASTAIAATPAVEQTTPPSAPVSPVSDTTDPRTQPASAAVIQQAAYPPATPLSTVEQSTPIAAPAPEQPVTQTYHASPSQPQQSETQAYAYTPLQQPLTQPYAPALQPTPKRNPALAIVGVVVAVMLLLGIISAAVVFANRTGVLQAPAQATLTPTPAATATATIPIGFTQFTDEGKVYSLNYPSGWRKTVMFSSATSSDVSGVLFSQAPAGIFEVEYIKTTATAGTTTLDAKWLHDTFFSGLEIMGKVTNRQDSKPVLLSGETWQCETADVVQDKITQHVVALTTTHGPYQMLIAYLGSKDTFTSTDSQDFQPMLVSFQFL